MKKTLFISIIIALSICVVALATISLKNDYKSQDKVQAFVDFADKQGEVNHAWRFFGYDEVNYTYMKDGQKLLSDLASISSEPVYVRAHHLLTSGDGTPGLKWGSTGAYTEGGDGEPIYDWSIVDSIFDTYVERGIKPFVEIGFMPEGLSPHPEDYPKNIDPKSMVRVDGGQAYPPKDYDEWEELVYWWIRHSIKRYGEEEVLSWYFEVWNEPNILYWKGTREEYFKLYDYSVAAIKRALPDARVGGPSIIWLEGDTFLKDFLDHCAEGTNYVTGEVGSPLDFISFHAKGQPKYVDGQVVMGIRKHLDSIDSAFSVISRNAEFNNLPVIITESDPEGCAACQGENLSYRNGSLYASYTASMYHRTLELAKKYNINLVGSLTWAFEFEDQPYFSGFRALSSNGINLPIFNLFELLGKMGGESVSAFSSGEVSMRHILNFGVDENSDVGVSASINQAEKKAYIMIWNYRDDSSISSESSIELKLKNLPVGCRSKVTHYQIDQNNSNSYSFWKKIGSPQDPTNDQYVDLIESSKITVVSEDDSSVCEDETNLEFNMPQQSVRLIVVDMM